MGKGQKFAKALATAWGYRLLNPGTVMKTWALARRVTSDRRWPVVVQANTSLQVHRQATIVVKELLKVGVGHPPGDDPKLRTVLQLDAGSTLAVLGRVTLFPGTRITLYPGARLSIGDRTFINAESKVFVWDSITIGSHCAIAWNVTIMDCDSHRFIDADGVQRPYQAPVVIEDHVWIGANVMILKGVHIGRGAVVGANSVVTHHVPAHAFVAGQPARVIKTGIDWY